jgi:adenylate cyclase
VPFLNEYLSVMTDIIMDEEAYLDKYEGDAIMAVFGVPLDHGDHAIRACRASLANRRALPKLWEDWEARGLPKLNMRIGLNTGAMVVGNMGSERRLDYTVIGDTVNLASRLEGANKVFGTHLMIGPETQAQAADHFETRQLALLTVKGKVEPVKTFELLTEKGTLSEKKQEIIGHYSEGLDLFYKREWDKAISLFEKANAVGGPDEADGPSEFYLGVCREYLAESPGDNWNGVVKLETK